MTSGTWAVHDRLSPSLKEIMMCEVRTHTMAQNAFGRALVASGGTLLVLGGATIGLSTVSMAVTKIVVDKAKVFFVKFSGTVLNVHGF